MRSYHLIHCLFILIISILTPITKLYAQEFHAQDSFWNHLQGLCGKSFRFSDIKAPAGDTLFLGKEILIHARICAGNNIIMHLHVGENRSRTWIFSRTEQGIVLKHDHRKADGSVDEITQYGGITNNLGTATTQYFPADEETRQVLPAAAANVWWIEIKDEGTFTYNLHRLGTDRKFSILFDTKNEQATPPMPWGWE